MKISFKVLNGNKVASNNNAVLAQFIISEDGLNTTLEVCSMQNKSVWDFLSHKKVFVALPMKKDGSDFRACNAFVVRRADGSICIWSNQFLNFEEGDAIFTTKAEADALANTLNISAEDEALKAALDQKIAAVEARLAEARELREKTADYGDKTEGFTGFALDAMVNILDDDIEEQQMALDILKMIKSM